MNSRKRFSALAAFAAVAAVISLTPSASADSFVPLPDPPTQEVLSAPSTMQPAYPNSTSVYTVAVAVGSQGTVANIDYIEMCWWKTSSGLSECTYDSTNSLDPRTQFKMTWYNYDAREGADPAYADEWFSIAESYDGGGYFWTNHYENANSTSGYGDGTDSSMNIVFKFRVSNAMLAGNDWNVRVTAYDLNGSSTPQTHSNISVNYFGAVTQDRSSQDFGNLGSSNNNWIVEEIEDGDFVANGPSDLTYKATSFTYEVGGSVVSEIPLATGTPTTSVPQGQAAVDCNPNWNWDENSAVRMSSSPYLMRENVIGDSGTEWGQWFNFEHACRVIYPGGASVANVTYGNTFTVGIGSN